MIPYLVYFLVCSAPAACQPMQAIFTASALLDQEIVCQQAMEQINLIYRNAQLIYCAPHPPVKEKQEERKEEVYEHPTVDPSKRWV